MEITTADGKKVKKGDRVFNYYDIEFGQIVSEPDSEGWFDFKPERWVGGRGHTTRRLNGERISTFQPEWMK